MAFVSICRIDAKTDRNIFRNVLLRKCIAWGACAKKRSVKCTISARGSDAQANIFLEVYLTVDCDEWERADKDE